MRLDVDAVAGARKAAHQLGTGHEEAFMLDVVLLTAGLVALVVGTLFAHLKEWSISSPLLGLVAGVVIGPEVLGAASIPDEEAISVMATAARLLLAVALMAIALRYSPGRARRHAGRIAVLVLVVLPVMAAVAGLGAAWALDLPLAVAVVLGAALSPTDPVLASSIVTGDAAERDIPVDDREILSLESGVNDGLALPLVILAVAWVLDRPFASEVGTAAYEVVGALLVGVVAGTAAGWGLRWAQDHREIAPSIRSLYTLVLAAFALGAAGVLAMDALLCVFVAGLAHNHMVSGGDRRAEVSIDEPLTQFLVVPVFVLLGVVLPWSAWGELGWGGIAFVGVALFLRRLPVVLALRWPFRESWAHVTWLGWFGPIGVAALFYLGHVDEEGVTDPRVWAAGTLVVAASTVVHGLTAGPARVAYRRSSVGASSGG